MEIEGFVLVGGAGSRMGRDKASLAFGGTTLGRRAARAMGEFAGRVFAVGGEIPGVPSVPDLWKLDEAGMRSSMVGLHSALSHATSEWIAVLACDLPFVDADLFRMLIAEAEKEPANVDAIVPLQADQIPQPLAAIYRRVECLHAVEEKLARRELRIRGVLDRFKTIYFDMTNRPAPGAAHRMFLNINTPDQYRDALELARFTSTACA